jgi:hypothetical protein
MSLEERLTSLEKRVRKIEDKLAATSSPSSKVGKISQIDEKVAAKVDEIGTQDLIVIALNVKPKQSKSQIKSVLENWGKALGNWFQGGNFNARLLKKGIVKKDGTDQDGNDVYSLTMKGENLSKALIDEL